MKILLPIKVLIVPILIIFSTYVVLYSQESKKKPDDGWARVAIAEFIDNTGTKDYRYLKASISDAMDGFMQKRFQYIRIEPNIVNLKGIEYLDGLISPLAVCRRNFFDIGQVALFNASKTHNGEVFIHIDTALVGIDLTSSQY